MRAAILIALTSILSPVHAQAPPKQEFEVAAIKPFARNPDGRFPIGVKGGPGTADPGRITYTNYTLKFLLRFAYDVKDYQISAPDWLDSEAARFTIEATIRPDATKQQVNQMLQNLLADRFKMTLHRETKEFQLHELVLGKNGPKLKESTDDPAPQGPAGPGRIGNVIMGRTGTHRITGRSSTASDLAALLSTRAFGPVLDKTGLTGRYDFTLEYALSSGEIDNLKSQGLQVEATPASDLLTALQEQLGLKLEAKKGPIEMLVVDHAEKTPTEN